jgi:hypothetical protein
LFVGIRGCVLTDLNPQGNGPAGVSRCAEEGEFAIHHDGRVAASHEELHDALARAGESGPLRLSVGILVKPSQFLPFEIEFHLAEPALGRAAHGVFMVLRLDHGRAFDRSLAPSGNGCFLEIHQVLAF